MSQRNNLTKELATKEIVGRGRRAVYKFRTRLRFKQFDAILSKEIRS